MKLHLTLIALLAACGACAEEKCLVQQFTLQDGRVLQALRAIKISKAGETLYVISVKDGTRVSFQDYEVLKIDEAAIPVSDMPVSLNVEPKPPAAPSAEPSKAVAQEPSVADENPQVNYAAEGPVRYIYVQTQQPRQHTHTVTPPPPPAAPPAPRNAPSAPENARQAFSTIPSFSSVHGQRK
jgi:hypothetical protein